jgi:hypothetical protein
MKSSRSTERVVDFSMSADGIAISPSGFDPSRCLEEAQEVFVRIYPVIEGSPQSKGKSGFCQGFLSKDQEQWFILRSVQDEGEGVARLHYVRDPKKKNKNKKATETKKSKTH